MQACRKGERFGQVSVLSPPGAGPCNQVQDKVGASSL